MNFLNQLTPLYHPCCLHCGRELKVVLWDSNDPFGSLWWASEGCLCRLPESVLTGLVQNRSYALTHYRIFRSTWLTRMGLNMESVAAVMAHLEYPLPSRIIDDITTILVFRQVQDNAESCVSVFDSEWEVAA